MAAVDIECSSIHFLRESKGACGPLWLAGALYHQAEAAVTSETETLLYPEAGWKRT